MKPGPTAYPFNPFNLAHWMGQSLPDDA